MNDGKLTPQSVQVVDVCCGSMLDSDEDFENRRQFVHQQAKRSFELLQGRDVSDEDPCSVDRAVAYAQFYIEGQRRILRLALDHYGVLGNDQIRISPSQDEVALTPVSIG